MITSTQNAFDKLKKDLALKDQQLIEKDKEINFLRGNRPAQSSMDGLQRRKLISDLSYMIETGKREL